MSEAVDDLTEAERLGLIVAAAYGTALAERDAARTIAVTLEQELAETRRHLSAVIAVLWTRGTTWAGDTRVLTEATEFLNAAVDSPLTRPTPPRGPSDPTQGPQAHHARP